MITRRKPIRRVSSKRAGQKREYIRERKFFLIENPWCVWGLRQQPPIKIRSTEIHHTRGRVGRLLNDKRFWMAVSAEGHAWIHRNIKIARTRGLICDHGHWNTVPKEFPPSASSNRQVADALVNSRAAGENSLTT